MSIDPARRAAYDALHELARTDGYANLLIPKMVAHLDGRDAAFTTELVYGTLRRLDWLDAVIAACVDRPLVKVDPRLMDVLRLGAYQLLELRVPSHAAVSASVDLARSVAGEGPAKFVNAVLRKVSRKDSAAWASQLLPKDELERLAMQYSHPRWIVEALRDALGPDAAELPDLLAIDNEAATVTLVARPGRAAVDELIAAGARPGRWSPYAAELPSGRPADIPAVAEHRAGVQDEGSQLVALALARVDPDTTGETWLDMCAGPGGKSALLAGIAAERGGQLVAADLREHRAGLIVRGLGAQPGLLGVVVADGARPAWRPGSFDRVLVDAPCTGLGSLRRRPEARWRKEISDVAGLAPVQRALLRSAIDAVRVGGVVAYATCSPHLAETDGVVAAVIGERTDIEVIDARQYLPEVPNLGPGPAIRLWPHRHGTDGMFLTLLRRRSGQPAVAR